MEVRSDAELRDWSIEVGIATPLGNPLFVTTTEMLGIDLAPLQGTRQFTLTLPEVHLGSGDYAVRTTLRSGDGAEIHCVPVGAHVQRADGGQQPRPRLHAGDLRGALTAAPGPLEGDRALRQNSGPRKPTGKYGSRSGVPHRRMIVSYSHWWTVESRVSDSKWYSVTSDIQSSRRSSEPTLREKSTSLKLHRQPLVNPPTSRGVSA